MKVSELIALLQTKHPDAEVRVNCDGSIYATDSTDVQLEYNKHAVESEVFIVTTDDWV